MIIITEIKRRQDSHIIAIRCKGNRSFYTVLMYICFYLYRGILPTSILLFSQKATWRPLWFFLLHVTIVPVAMATVKVWMLDYMHVQSLTRRSVKRSRSRTCMWLALLELHRAQYAMVCIHFGILKSSCFGRCLIFHRMLCPCECLGALDFWPLARLKPKWFHLVRPRLNTSILWVVVLSMMCCPVNSGWLKQRWARLLG